MKDFLESAKNLINKPNEEVYKRLYKIELNDILIALFFVFISNYSLNFIINGSLELVKPLALTSILIIGTFIIWICGLLGQELSGTIKFWSKLYLLATLSFIFNVIQIPLQIIGKFVIPESIQTGYFIAIYGILIILSNFMLIRIISLGFRFDIRKTILTFILFLSISGILLYLVQTEFGLIIPFFLIGK